MAITPALSISTSHGRSPQRLAKFLTELSSARSSCCVSTVPPLAAARMSAAAASPLAGSRTASTILAPSPARLVAVARPSPLLPPVMMTVLPAIDDGAAATGSDGKNAVARPPASAARRSQLVIGLCRRSAEAADSERRSASFMRLSASALAIGRMPCKIASGIPTLWRRASPSFF